MPELLLGHIDREELSDLRGDISPRDRLRQVRQVRLSNYPKTLSSPGFYGGYTPFSDSYLIELYQAQKFAS